MKKTTRLLSLLLVLVLCLSVLPMGALAASSGWQKEGGYWYYYENGTHVTGWKKISGAWYYFDPNHDGMMYANRYLEDPAGSNVWYHFGSSGAMDTSKWVKDTYTSSDGTTYSYWCYQLSSGKGAMGWQQIGGVWYYFDPNNNGYMVTGGPIEIDGKWYYFKSSGAMYTGWKKYTEDDGTVTWFYFTSSGAAKKDGWLKISGKWYQFENYICLNP